MHYAGLEIYKFEYFEKIPVFFNSKNTLVNKKITKSLGSSSFASFYLLNCPFWPI